MLIKPLNTIKQDEIIACFIQAFENYYVPMPTSYDYYIERWKAAGVDYALSYGMFDNNLLVGFIIHAIDKRNDYITAYNTGTGVIPDYRGNRIVKSIYEFAIHDLKANGIQKSTLEVIQDNEKAIKAYQGVGFEICKSYDAFSGKIELDEVLACDIVPIAKEAFDWQIIPNRAYYSWDFQKETLLRREYKYYYVMHNQEIESFFMYHTETNYIGQFDVLMPNEDAWLRLLSAIAQTTDTVKIINVDSRLTAKLEALQQSKLKNIIKQYEMELDLQ